MREFASIAPNGREPGVIAYYCPSCRYVTSALLPPAEPRQRWPATMMVATACACSWAASSLRLGIGGTRASA